MDNFNKLPPAPSERLAILLEEMGESQQIIGKILRHGYESENPFRRGDGTNRILLEKELGHVMLSIFLLCTTGDLDYDRIELSGKNKAEKIKQWLHHQNPNDLERLK